MTEINITLRKKKKERLKINNIDDFKKALIKEGYKINALDKENFKKEITKTLKVNKNVTEKLYNCIEDTDITYIANNINDFMEYIGRIMVFENNHKKLWEKIRKIKNLSIHRIEYEKECGVKEDVHHIIHDIEEIKGHKSASLSEEGLEKLKSLEKELDKEYIYTKDIELLKKMILYRKEDVKQVYDKESKINTISIEIPKKINDKYIPVKIGSIEYHSHLKSNIPRMKRLIKNINKYMIAHGKEEATYIIDQSKTLQDSINIAVAIYDNKEFKAISGSNDIDSYCKAPKEDKAAFKSIKVNRLGKLGIGYNRVNDSEKKILEEIHRQIESKELKDQGNLILYSKWEPCPSCYYVISQFSKRHPNINVQIKYGKRYGEL